MSANTPTIVEVEKSLTGPVVRVCEKPTALRRKRDLPSLVTVFSQTLSDPGWRLTTAHPRRLDSSIRPQDR